MPSEVGHVVTGEDSEEEDDDDEGYDGYEDELDESFTSSKQEDVPLPRAGEDFATQVLAQFICVPVHSFPINV